MTATAVVARLDRAMTAVLLQTAQRRRVLAPNQNIENNPMQSNKGASAWMLYPSKTF
jgi:hypothetical protein